MSGHGVGLRESEEDGLRDAVFQRHPTSAKGFVQANHIRDDRGCALSQLILPGISTSTPWRSVQTWLVFLAGCGKAFVGGQRGWGPWEQTTQQTAASPHRLRSGRRRKVQSRVGDQEGVIEPGDGPLRRGGRAGRLR